MSCYGVLKFIVESMTRDIEVLVSGQLWGKSAKTMKLVDGLRMYNGDPGNDYIGTDVCHGLLRYGVLSLKAKIVLLWEPRGKIGPRKPLPANMSTMQP